MASYYKHVGCELDYTPTSAVSAGAVVKIQDSVTAGYIGISNLDISANVKGSLSVEGVYEFPLKSGDTPVLGTLVYWDSTNGEITTTSTAMCLAGRCEKIVGTTVWVKINVR
jgi:predicted RecA/RadA family phage recombinase